MKKHLFTVKEIGRGIDEEYPMMMTDDEMTKFLEAKNDMNGYLSGLGGDRTYSAIAWYCKY